MEEFDENTNYEEYEFEKMFNESLRETEKVQKPRRMKWKLYHKAVEFAKKSTVFSFEELQKHLHVSETIVDKIVTALLNNEKIRSHGEGYIAIYKCDVCGKEEESMFINDIHHIFGYGSKYDMSLLDLNVCDECFDKMFENILPMFKINPLKDYDVFNHIGKDNKSDGKLYIEVLEEHEKNPF